MKKLLVLIAIGFVATAISILLKSNYAIVICMAMFIMMPLGLIFTKVISCKQLEVEELEAEPKESIYIVPTDASKFDQQLSRRERMRSEANQLQAELMRIQKDPSAINRIEKMAKWKVKSEIHHSLYLDLYEEMRELDERFDRYFHRINN